MRKKKILIISLSDLDKDPRVRRHINFLKDDYEIVAAGYKDPNIKDVKFVQVKMLKSKKADLIKRLFYLKTHQFENYYWNKYDFKALFVLAEKEMFDVIIANDVNTLPLAFKIKKDAKIVFDAHEYAPLEFEDSIYWRFFFQRYQTYLCEKYIPKVDAMFTVGELIANEYENNFGVKSEIITNAPPYHSELSPIINNSYVIKIIHQGIAFPSRKLELMIEAMKYLGDRYKLYLMLIENDSKYMNKLRKKAQKMSNVEFLEPISSDRIVKYINSFDIGLHIIAPTNFNNACALPNKFFEFIQARLALVVGPSPEMKRLVEKYSLGVITKDFSPLNIANAIKSLNKEDIIRFKSNTHKIAYEMSADHNRIKYLNIIQRVLN